MSDNKIKYLNLNLNLFTEGKMRYHCRSLDFLCRLVGSYRRLTAAETSEIGEVVKQMKGDAENQEAESEKSISRRRCSDLDFFKKRKWHKIVAKGRRSRKKRILSYFAQIFDPHHSLFAPIVVPFNLSLNLENSKANAEDEEKFNELKGFARTVRFDD